MRIRDWSSDVCSSDLLLALFLLERFGITADYVCREFYSDSDDRETSHAWLEWNGLIIDISGDQFEWPAVIVTRDQIGRASCRERVCQSVSILVVAVPLKKKHIESKSDGIE